MRAPASPPSRSYPLAGSLARLGLASVLLAGALTGAPPARAASATLRILHITPTGGATDVPASGFVSIAFDRPVVRLGDVGVTGSHPAAAIAPAIKGQGRWINSSIWAYQVPGGLSLATRYTVTTRPDLVAADGSRLAGATSFAFETLRPGVLSVTPPSGTRYALRRDSGQITFNQPVVRASAERAFRLLANGVPVPVRFSWASAPIATQPNGSSAVVPSGQGGSGPGGGPPPPPAKDTLLTFRPSVPLPLGAGVQVALATGIRGQQGPLGMASPYTWRYGVAGRLAVLASTPSDGDTSATLGSGVQLTLSAPADPALIGKAVHVSPTLSSQYVSLNDAGTIVSINGDFMPSTTYTIAVDARTLGTAGQSLAASYRLRFTSQPATPAVSLISQGPAVVYNAYKGATVYARVTNLPSVSMSLFRLSAGQFFGLLSSPPQNWQGALPSGASLIASYTVATRAPLNRGYLAGQRLRANGRDVPPGYYLLDAGAGSGGGLAGDHQLLLITRTNITLKIGQRQAFVWATDLRSGKPVAGESVRVVDSKGHLWAGGTTAADGVFQAPVHGLAADDSLLQHTLQAQLSHGIDIAACSLDWNNGVGPWDFSLPFATYQQPVRIYLSTERPIYRPGQPVYFKGIARDDHDGRYIPLAAGSTVTIAIRDTRQNTVSTQRLRVDASGGFSGSLRLSPAASLGVYGLSAAVGVSIAVANFQVAEYKKPSYNVAVISDRGANANYAQGERIGVAVRARYYFGAALAAAPLTWDLTQGDFTFASPLFPDYDFVDQDYAATTQQTSNQQQTTQGAGRTDGSGGFRFSVPADIVKSSQSQQYTLEAIVTGPDAQQVAQSAQVVVHKAGLYVGLRPEDYLATAGKGTAIKLVTVSDDGSHIVGGVGVTARVYRRTWYSGYVRDAQGYYYYQNSHKDALVTSLVARTDGQGRAIVGFTPKGGGEYRIVASARDPQGRQAIAATALWVAGAGESYVPWQTQNNDRIRLVADKKSYAPGDTAHVLVTAPLARMTALITVERGGVLSHRVISLPTNSTSIAVPIEGLYAPDVYVSVTLVKGPGADTQVPVWRLGYVALPVDTVARTLHLTLAAAPGTAKPGQKVTFRIHAADAAGTGVRAQLAVSLVDKAVLALADSAGTGLMDTFYQQRSLGVESAGSLTLNIDNLQLDQKVGAKGGSGGGGGPGGSVRSKFPDTAYWNPTVTTDGNGDATLTITLPDNLTTWTFSVLGGTAGTLVGQASVDLVSTKALLLEPALPRFLTLGDTVQGGAVVNNLTTKDQQVVVVLEINGRGPAGDYKATTLVPAGGSRLVQWPVQALALGTQDFLITVHSQTNSALSDALQISLPVQPGSIAEVSSSSGLLSRGSVTQSLAVPADAVPGEGGLSVELAPSLVSDLGPAVASLTDNPYPSAEAATSGAYGLAEALRLPQSVNGLSAAQISQAPGVVQQALGQLYNAQNSDGGWGWWQEDASQPYLSAYVLDGLTALRGRGIAVDTKVLKAAATYVRGWALSPQPASTYLPDATTTLDLRAYSAYVLGEAGSADPGLVGTLYARRQNLLPFARAYLALAVARVAGATDPRARNLLAEIEAATQQVGNQAHWSDKGPDWLMMDTEVSATAVALDALVRLDPANPLVLASVRWLVTRRVDGTWGTSQGTALAIRALADYAVRIQPPGAAGSFSLVVNGRTIGGGTLAGTRAGAARRFTVPVSSLGTSARVTLRQQGGSAQVAYTITLRTYRAGATAPATERGISISRRYEPIGGGRIDLAGSQVRVVLTLTAAQDLYYLNVEDPLPAGAEPVDPSLKTTSVLSGITAQTTIPRGTTDLGWYVSHVESRDDRTALFADYLPAGTYRYSYQIHLTSAGRFGLLPVQTRLQYFPDVYGHSGGGMYTIAAR